MDLLLIIKTIKTQQVTSFLSSDRGETTYQTSSDYNGLITMVVRFPIVVTSLALETSTIIVVLMP